MNNKTQQFTPNGFLRTLSILHMALMAGPILFGAFAYVQVSNTTFGYLGTKDFLIFIVPVFTVIAIFLGDFIFKKITADISKTKGLKQKLMRFQSASILKYASVEAPALFAVIAFYITNNLAFILIASILIFYFFSLRPTKDKILRSLSLSMEEKNQFNKMNQPIDG
ncbi:hypothetical protein HME9304_02291 [Flagellimonas maritima]|uniref:Uncharacterized protein n=1 Tax=Flagellimonas maritima TaxID=1383885 RepID=A0A2Z4LU52_9FLAO|nr:hypothetical protein [Allomuricauda aurantiaca]AWX45279.1 hypothetical protein HME9304_02291 [Allomuricauda aurantiaca]